MMEVDMVFGEVDEATNKVRGELALMLAEAAAGEVAALSPEWRSGVRHAARLVDAYLKAFWGARS